VAENKLHLIDEFTNRVARNLKIITGINGVLPKNNSATKQNTQCCLELITVTDRHSSARIDINKKQNSFYEKHRWPFP